MFNISRLGQIAVAVAVIGVLGSLRPITVAQQTTDQQMPNAVPAHNTGPLMRAKLGSSQRVVEGLMAADFVMIEKGANDLLAICDSSNWLRLDDIESIQYRAELRRAANKMVAQSKKGSLEGVAYVYMHALTTCINCHQHSRDVLRIANATDASQQGVVPIPVTEEGANRFRDGVILR